MPDNHEILAEIRRAMPADRYRLSRRLRNLERHDKQAPGDSRLDQLLQDARRSSALRRERRDNLPSVGYDDALPITAHRAEIAAAVREHPVVVVCGETGSGKSTQLPKICLELGRGVDGMIGHTQPRRIAARSVAARVAEELGSHVSGHVGFKVRFTDKTSPRTYVKLMTDGVLLAETQGDRFLDQYDTLIIDEAHERSLNIDFLLGYVKRLLAKRRDLKLIITSATIDAARFSGHFGTADRAAPVIEVSGRGYPVEVRYRPAEVDEDGEELDEQRHLLSAVEEAARIDKGDILIFMPTERHIREAAKYLRGRRLPGDYGNKATEILPLYGRLSTAEQNRVFAPHPHRRIVLATNVAESSLTVPGIHYVIDTGTARISRYSARSQVQRLPIEPISRASADQRAGRCGRIAPGVCLRLFSEEDYLARDRYTTPEILRTNLASVVLQTLALKLGPIEEFPFLDPPKPPAIRDGYKTLHELGALDERNRLTETGRRLSRLPVDPRIGRMVLAAAEEDCLHEVLIIASALEVQDPRERPVEKQQAADERHAQFAHEHSDFFTYLNLWDFCHRLKNELSHGKLRKACQQNFLSYNRMREWLDVHRQLLQLAEEAGFKQQARGDDYAAVHRALLTGLLSSVAMRSDTYEYTASGGKFYLWPGSALFEKRPNWIVAAELVETSKRFLRTVARIEPGWIEPLAGHLVKRSYSEAHWNAKGRTAMAFEKVSLFGLPVVPRRRVRYGPIDPVRSRELFILHGLVEGDFDTKAEFWRHNQRLIERVEKLQAKLRRTGMLKGEQARLDFYHDRIPDAAYDGPRLEQWLRQAGAVERQSLLMSEADLLDDPAEAEGVEQSFPDSISIDHATLPLEYHLAPGTEQDGVTLIAPPEAVNQLDTRRLGWLVPGMLEHKVAALIKSLPKSLRRMFVPVPETAGRVAAEIGFAAGDLAAAVADALGKRCGQRISPGDFQQEKLPPHLQLNVRVVDAQGETLAEGRDVDELRGRLGAQAAASFAEVDDGPWTRDGILEWDFGPLPEEVVVDRGGIALKGFPALLDAEESISLRLMDTAEKSQRMTRGGVRRLFVCIAGRALKSHVDWLPDLDQLTLYAATVYDAARFRRQAADLIADRALFAGDETPPRCAEDFQQRSHLAHERLDMAAGEVARLLTRLLPAYHEARLAVDSAEEGPGASSWQYALDDIRGQFDCLLPSDFLTVIPWTWLSHYPRFFRAISVRLEKLASGGLARDQSNYRQFEPLWREYLDLESHGQERLTTDERFVHYRWMLEEFRVSLFAQQLGTSIPVSLKRLKKAHWKA